MIALNWERFPEKHEENPDVKHCGRIYVEFRDPSENS
jgi:hypothetical protein